MAYTLRVNVSVAAQQMRTELNWCETQKGLVLSSFYWGYALGQLPASYFALLNGAKFIFGMSVLIPSVLTLLFPLAAEKSFELALLVRMSIGLVEACCFPAVFHFFPHWIPEQDKTIMVPFILSGVYMGEIIAFFFSGLIIEQSHVVQGYELLGWRGAFYVFGLIGVCWCPLWLMYAHERPEDHPLIAPEELEYIQRGYLALGQHDINSSNLESGNDNDSNDFYGSKNVYKDASDPVFGSRSRAISVEGGTRTPSRERAPSGTFGERLLLANSSSSSSSSLLQQQRRHSGSAMSRESERVALLTEPLLLESNPMVLQQQHVQTLPHSHSHSHSHSQVHHRHYSRDQSQSQASSTHSQASLASAVLAPVGMVSTAVRDPPIDDINNNNNNNSNAAIMHTPPHAAPSIRDIFFMVPWFMIFRSPAIVTLFVASFTNGYVSFLLLSEMPSYLTDELGFDLASAGYLCVAPYAALFFTSLGFGSFFYSLQRRFGWNTRTVRQIAQFVAFAGSSAALLLCGFVSKQNRWFSYCCLVAAQGMLGAGQSGLACCYLDVCPRWSPQLNTVGNVVSALAGIAGPLIVSALLGASPGEWGWRCVFIITTAMSLLSLILWRLFQSSEIDIQINDYGRVTSASNNTTTSSNKKG